MFNWDFSAEIGTIGILIPTTAHFQNAQVNEKFVDYGSAYFRMNTFYESCLFKNCHMTLQVHTVMHGLKRHGPSVLIFETAVGII